MKAKHIGRILAGVGLVLLVSAPFTFVVNTPIIAGGKVLLGLICIGIYLITNFGELGQFASSKGTFFFVTSAISAALLIGALGGVNYILAKNPKSWDLTKNQIHTLAPDTVKTLEGLKEDVTAYAFFRPGDPGYDVLNDLFGKYKVKSERFKFEFIDYSKDPLKVKEFDVRESGPRVIVKLGSTESRFGATAHEMSEESLTNAIVKVTHSSTKKVYYTTGHGEADVDDSGEMGLSEVKKRMENEGLKAEKLNLVGLTEIPADAEAVVVAGPAKPFQPAEAELLHKYLDNGGKAFLMVEPLVTSGLEGVMRSYSIEADETVVVDPISRLFGAGETVPVVQNYNPEHAITRDFKINTLFPTARPITVLHDDGPAKAEPVALSMPSAWGENNPQGQVQRYEDEKGGPFPLVAAVTRDTKTVETKKSDQARLVVAGDRDFATNRFRAAYGNEDFFLNSLNWLAEQTERITIRPRMRDASRLYLTDTQRAAIFFVAIDIMPVTLLAVGLSVWLARRAK